jgi:Flp pilus assembly CpaE family ATPase
MPSTTFARDAPAVVLLIEDNPGDARLVQEILSEAEGAPFQVEWVQALLAGLERLTRGDIDVVLLDLSLPDSQGIDSVTTIRAHAPNVAVVVLTGLDNQDFAQQAVLCGAQDYLIKGELNANAFARTLRYAILRQRSKAEAVHTETQAELGRVIGLLGAKGGVGTSTLAIHLSLELKRQTGSRVLLADLDVHSGSIGFLTKTDTPHTIGEAANNLLRLDESYWNMIIDRGAEGLEILRSQGYMTLEEQANSERVRHVLRFTRSLYQWIIIDLGRLNPFCAALLPDLSDLFLIATLDVPALYEVKQLVSALPDAGVDIKRLHLIINQTPKRSDYSPSEIGGMLGVPIYAVLPESNAELEEAYTSGKLLSEKSNLNRQIARLSARIAGLDVEKSK